MAPKKVQGQFEVIDSFVIRRRNEVYLIGMIKEGTVKENWFINVPFNNSMGLTARISTIEDVEISSESKTYKLLIISGDKETTDLLFSMNIASEYLDITIEGED